METKKLCIYHGGCTDGVAAAWVVWSQNLGYEFHAGVYGEDPPWDKIDEDTEVLIVDFSYTRLTMIQLSCIAQNVIILDHHKTAKEDIKPLLDDGLICGEFDMNRCGTLMTWDWFNPLKKPPILIKEIDLYDRWQPGKNDALMLAIKSYRHHPESNDAMHFNDMMRTWFDLMRDDMYQFLLREGYAINKFFTSKIEELTKEARLVKIANTQVLSANAPYFMASKLGNELATKSPSGIGLTWYQSSSGDIKISLRSIGDADVSKIAQEFGGGGHKNAAGFVLDSSRLNDVLNLWNLSE